MCRLFYRLLIALHPREFREPNGDEILCIFDESPPGEIRPLLADGVLSLVRQWLFHSSAWKLAVGTIISGSFLLLWGYSIPRDFDSSMRWAAERNARIEAMYGARRSSPLDRQEFARETAAAVAMLARFRQMEKQCSRKSNQADRQATGRDSTEISPADN
ncbi:MAG: hypothetical protein ACRD4R_01680 [Candidatus Acidiferrales bacterium]